MKGKDSPIALRPVNDEDREFLLSVYEASREIELAMTEWNPEQRRAFVEHQYTAQDAHYREHYKGASFSIIVYADEPVGRLYVHRGDEEIEILDITVLTEYRNRGIATSLVREITNDAAAINRPVCIYIESFNPSQKLFGELGFAAAGGDAIVRRFEWHAPRDR